MTFAERLRELRDAKGLSEARLAVAAGLPVPTVHNYGLGRRKPSLAAAVRLAKAMGVDCTAFADCEDVVADGEDTSAEAPPPPKRGRARKAAESPPPAPPKQPRKGKGAK